MASTSVEQAVKSIISEVLPIDRERIDDGDHLIDDLGADSLHVIEIQMKLEERFHIDVPDEAIDRILVVGNAIQWIEDHLP